MAKVSIVMRTKDRLPFLKRALADVAAQSFTDWDLLIINDAGDKVALDALFASQAENLRRKSRLLHLTENHGGGGGLLAQLGLDETEGTYLVLHDDDDTWHPNFLQRTVEYLDTHTQAPAVAVRTEIIFEEADGAGGWRETGREIQSPDIHEMSLLELMVVNRTVPIGCLYRREAVLAVGNIGKELPVVDDWWLHLRLARYGTFGFIDGEPLAFWHQRRGVSGDLGNSVIALSDAHWIYDRRVRDAAMRDTLNQTPHLLGLALQSGLHMRYMHEHAAALHEHLEYMRGEMRHLLHENLRKHDALQAQLAQINDALQTQLTQINGELAALRQEHQAAQQARETARQEREDLRQLQENTRQEQWEILSFVRRIKRICRFWKRGIK